MSPDQKLDLLKQEYFKLQDFYEDFDKRAHGIKNWSITASIAAIAAGVSGKNEYLGLFGAMSALVFWITETIWKIFQYHYRERIEEIEQRMRLNEFDSFIPLQIYTSWFDSYKKRNFGFFSVFSLATVFLPHIFIIILDVLFFALQHYHVFRFWYEK